jgi:hypothetical protein
MKFASAKLFVILIIFKAASAVDYCKLCKDHIACRHNGKFASTCPKDARMVGLGDANIKVALEAHNKVRNTIAGGGVAHLKSATKMMTLVSC